MSMTTLQFTDNANFVASNEPLPKYAGDSMQAISFVGGPDNSKSGGWVVYATPKGQYPSEDAGASKVVISTGEETTINVKQTTYTSLSTSRRPCLPPQSSVSYHNFLIPNASITYEYSKWTCLESWRSKKIINACGCAIHDAPILLGQNVTYCLDFNLLWSGKLKLEELLDRYSCVTKTVAETVNSLRGTNACRANEALCSSTSYSSDLYSVQWPLSSLTPALGSRVVVPRQEQLRNETKMHAGISGILNSYSQIFDDSEYDKATSGTISLALSKENFLYLHIRSAKHRAIVIHETLSYPLGNLFSDFGGIMGMYIGVSVLSICELIEFVVTLVKLFHSQKVQSKDNDNYPANKQHAHFSTDSVPQGKSIT